MTGQRKAAAIVTVLVLTGCSIHSESAPRLLDPSAAPFREIGQSPTPLPTGVARALVYLIRDGQLVAVVRRVPAPAAAGDVLAALLGGPNSRESDAGLTTSVLSDLTLGTQPTPATGSPARETVYVNLPTSSGTDSGRSDEVLEYAQVVLTLTSLPAISSVVFLRDGQALDVPRADGSLAHGPLSRGDYITLL